MDEKSITAIRDDILRQQLQHMAMAKRHAEIAAQNRDAELRADGALAVLDKLLKDFAGGATTA